MRSTRPIGLVAVLGAVYLLVGGVLLSAAILYKNTDDPLRMLAIHRHGVALVAGVLVIAGATAYLLSVYRRASDVDRRRVLLVVTMNAVIVVTSGSLGEAVVRIWSEKTSHGMVFAGTRLLPYAWDDVVERNRRLLEASPARTAYFVADALLGWTVGPGRRSPDGLYASSVEGVRSARAGVSYATRTPSHRVALVGDSYTFALEVPFEQSWGHALEGRLGPGAQVLNFGVDGYGVDQAYLRYLRDVRPWRPDVVVFGFIDHDLYRTMSVYTFLTFPEWEYPFAKPRFVVNAGKLELLNEPVPSPEQILSYRSVADLPFVNHEPGYHASQWEASLIHRSYLARFLVSRFPRWPRPRAEVAGDVVKSVNIEILDLFARTARREGTVPLVVYFPSRGDFQGDNRDIKDAVVEELLGRGLEYLDLTRCLRKVEQEARFIAGRPHYSQHGNAAVAGCLSSTLQGYLRGRKASTSSAPSSRRSRSTGDSTSSWAPPARG